MTEPLSKNGLIPAEDLYFLLGGNEKIKVLDATFAAVRGHSPHQAFLGSHIEGAQFFDIDVVADQESPLPHMLPSADYFADCISSLGISNDDHVVVYDQSGLYMASSRAWWMFRAFGHNNVYVLEGGMPAWKACGYATVSGTVEAPEPGAFKASPRPELVVDRNGLMNNLETGEILVLDARPSARFIGNAPEPRPGMRGGHIPGSLNLPFIETIDANGLFKSAGDLERLFERHDIAHDASLAVSCGSGVTACTVALALFKARGQDAAIYDGSWSEWGDENAGTPVEVSA